MASGSSRKLLDQLRRVTLAQDVSALTDERLLDCFVAQRDEAAFEALVRRHGPMVLGVCRRILGNTHDAEDAFQVTFLVLVRRAASIGRPELIGNWLYGVAYRTAQAARSGSARRRLREKQVPVMQQPSVQHQAMGEDDLLLLLDQELNQLPDKYRVPVILCELQGRSRQEAAGLLRLPEGTLSSRLATARKLLAERLARRGTVLSASALAAALSTQSASACVPPALVQATVQAALSLAAGQAAKGAISAECVQLLEGVSRTMYMTQLKKTALVLLLAVGIIGGGAGLLGYRVLADKAAAEKDDTQAELKAVLQKAIQGAGGADNLNKLTRVTCKAKGVVVPPGGDKEQEISFVASLHGLDQCRLDSITAYGRDNLAVFVFKREYQDLEGWLDNPVDVKQGSTLLFGAGFGHDLVGVRLAQWLVPLQGKDFEMSPLGNLKIGERQTVGIKFGHPDRLPLDLYFDKETGLPVKAHMLVPVKVGGAEQSLPDEFFFDQYKDIDGCKHFTKLTFQRDGKKRMELELSDITPQAKLDDKIFAKP